MKVWAIIPAFNEEQNLKNVLKALKEKELSILVIDDGSKDNTYKIANELADKVIRNVKNLGKGNAIRKGLDYLLKEEKFDYVLLIDGDGQHLVANLDNFLKEIDENNKFLIGNRLNNPSGMPKIRLLTNKFISWLISKIVKQKIEDTQCGFKLIAREVIEKINLTTDHFEIDSEMIIEARRKNFNIKSIPIDTIYFSDNKSKIKTVYDTLRFLKFIIRHL